MEPLGHSEGRVGEIVAALKEGIGVSAVGVFDDDRALLYASSETSSKAFWDVLRGMGCTYNWVAWYRDLRSAKHMVATCYCLPGHAIHAHLLFERWVVLVLFSGSPEPFADAVVASAVRLLAEVLPSTRLKRMPPVRGPRGGGGGESARLGIPLWWVRKS